jgi:hypothetical protein
VRVIGGWTKFQFAEKRMSSLEEIGSVASDTPEFILHLQDLAMVDRAEEYGYRNRQDTHFQESAATVLLSDRDEKG